MVFKMRNLSVIHQVDREDESPKSPPHHVKSPGNQLSRKKLQQRPALGKKDGDEAEEHEDNEDAKQHPAHHREIHFGLQDHVQREKRNLKKIVDDALEMVCDQTQKSKRDQFRDFLVPNFL